MIVHSVPNRCLKFDLLWKSDADDGKMSTSPRPNHVFLLLTNLWEGEKTLTLLFPPPEKRNKKKNNSSRIKFLLFKYFIV